MYDPVSILWHEELKQGFFCLVCNELFYNFTYSFEQYFGKFLPIN